MFRFLCLLLALLPLTVVAKTTRPNLILVIVYDQMRSDYLTRFESRFLPAHTKSGVGGFRYLMENGAYYPQAEHVALQDMTCPGHAMVLTGAPPYMNGIALNEWFDQGKQKRVYCVQDEGHHVVGVETKDPHPGTSPSNLSGTTFGDELKNAGLKSKVVALALKDRAAILLGGRRADIATWVDNSAGFRWVSSDYYLPKGDLPDWVQTLNRKLDLENGKKLTWTVTGHGTGRSSDVKVLLPKRLSPELGEHFPHVATAGSEESMALPYGVEKTEEAAEAAIAGLHLGRGSDPDLLAFSQSTHDLAGHFFGPNSREMEELTVVEDQSLAKLLNFINKNVPGGLAKTLIVLTADHGVAPNTDWMTANKVPAGRVDQSAVKDALNAFLNEKYGKPDHGDWINDFYELNFYVNRSAIKDRKVDLREVERTAANFVRDSRDLMTGVAHVFTGADVEARTLPPAFWEKLILNTYVPGRSGDLILIPKPNYVVGVQSATHLSGYSYDRVVPLILAGEAIKSGVRSQHAEVIDIAPTLSFLTGVIPPSGSTGRVLTEALK